HALHERQNFLEARAPPLGVDAMRFVARDAELAEARGARVVAVLDDVRERTRAFRAPLKAVELVTLEEILDGRVPERFVFGMIPARGLGRPARDGDGRDLRDVLYFARSGLENARVELHAALAHGRQHFLEEIAVGVVERRIDVLMSQRR